MLAALLILALPSTHTPQDPPELPSVELRAEDLGAWRKTIEPERAELAFEDIPWLPTFAEGVLAADRERKPLLFWAMNGHPLGCT